MKTKLIITGLLLATIFNSCNIKYLPISDNIDVFPYGSYIKVNMTTGEILKGELIAIENKKMFILLEENRQAVSIQTNEISKFKLQYATPNKNYAKSSFLILSTVSHGIWALFTAPLNTIVTTSVKAGGDRTFQYNDESMPLDKLKMFARFPQGIPPNIDIANLNNKLMIDD